MLAFTDLRELAPLLCQGSVVSWGNFDGVHLGHQALLRAVVSRSRGMQAPAVVVTFDPHPAVFFNGGGAPHSITDTADKLALLSRLDVDYTLVLPFTAKFAKQTPEEFVKNILADGLKAKAVILGYDVGFGKNRQGGIERLAELGAEHGFSAEKMPPTLGPSGPYDKADAVPVSSTGVREAIKDGEVDRAARLLGRVHSVHSIVEHGAGRGNSLLGFPTANIDPGTLLLPPHGVYACLVKCEDEFYSAAVNLGFNPSFNGARPSLEAHILDFDGNLYGKKIRIYFLRFLRAEKKFGSIQDLTEQIGLDVENTARVAAQARQTANFETLYPL